MTPLSSADFLSIGSYNPLEEVAYNVSQKLVFVIATLAPTVISLTVASLLGPFATYWAFPLLWSCLSLAVLGGPKALSSKLASSCGHSPSRAALVWATLLLTASFLAGQLLGESSLFRSPSPIVFIYSCLLAPVAEELWFRGVYLRQVASQFGLSRGLALQAAAFALSHGSLKNLLWIGFAGYAFGVLSCKSLAASTAAHCLFNIGAFVVAFFLPDISASLIWPLFFGSLALCLGLAVHLSSFSKELI